MNIRSFFLPLLFPLCVQAQNVEFGFAGGAVTNSSPSSNMIYKIDKGVINYAATVNMLYNVSDYLQYGLQGGLWSLSGTSNTVYTGPDNKTLIGGDNKLFMYAKEYFSLCGVFNGRYNIGRGYIYAGVALGFGGVKHKSTDLASNESYRAPDGGNGAIFGGQLGYVVGITHRFAFFAEAEYRYIDLKYDAEAPGIAPHTNLHYHLTAYPFVLGFRYRILNTIIDNNYPKQAGNRSSKI